MILNKKLVKSFQGLNFCSDISSRSPHYYLTQLSSYVEKFVTILFVSCTVIVLIMCHVSACAFFDFFFNFYIF